MSLLETARAARLEREADQRKSLIREEVEAYLAGQTGVILMQADYDQIGERVHNRLFGECDGLTK